MSKSKNGKGNGAKAPAEAKRFISRPEPDLHAEVIDDIHVKAELGRYRMRGFSLFKKIPHWDDLTFLPGTLTRFVIEGYREKCETKTVIGPRAKRPMVLDIPVYVTGMSFGALSYEAKVALARGATMAGTATCSGEGGMIPDERRYSRSGSISASSRATASIRTICGWPTPASSSSARAARSGSGGHLMGQKVTDQVAEMRSLPAGIDQRSPARHPDWLGPDDLALKIQEIREATNWEIPIQLKLGAARVYDDVRMAAKCGPDFDLYRRHGRRHRRRPAYRHRRYRRARHRRHPPGAPRDRRCRQVAARSASSMPAASATAATSPRRWRSAPTRSPSATRR